METVDLRSDTVTLPTDAMRAAMQQATLGDDVYGEDPTVNRLEAVAAERMGHEAAVFVPSGTMGNLAAILAHCGRGDEVLLGDRSHTYLFEAAGVSALGGVHTFALPNQADGSLDVDSIRNAIRPDDPHQPRSRLLALENTHNRCGGAVLGREYVLRVTAVARENGLRTHLDGARIFNAAAALELPVAELSAPFDSVSFCLSKALSAPVGSLLCGSAEFIREARRIRKQLGGGMRQAGVLAAAGLVALEEMPGLLHLDHARARRLAAGLAEIEGLELEYEPPPTNMVYCRLAPEAGLDASAVASEAARLGVKVGVVGKFRFRMVTHYWIDDTGVERAIAAMRRALESATSAPAYRMQTTD